MTNQDKKAFLMMYQEKCRDVDILQQEIETLQSKAERVTSTLSGMPRGGQGEGFVSAVDKIVELKEELNNKVLEAIEKRHEIVQAIDGVEDVVHRQILQKMYINGLNVINIASENNYSYRHTCRLHSEALNKIKIEHVL